MRSQNKFQNGFTIWELLIVVALIVILIAIALPAYQSRLTRAPANGAADPVPDEVADALQSMAWGSIAFNNPEVLSYGQTEVVQLVLSETKTENQLLSIISESGQRESYIVRVADEMEARLTGSAFEIMPITPETQIVNASDVTEWKWEIEPKKIGEQKLFLTLNAKLLLNDREKKHTVRTLSKTMHVRVVWPQSVAHFFWTYWQWICTAIALPLIGWSASRIFRSKKKNGS